VRRLLATLNPTDRIFTVFIVILTLYGIFTGHDLQRIALITGGNFLILASILFLVNSKSRKENKWLNLLYIFYPILLNIWIYPRACELRFGLFPLDFDPALLKLELLVFSREWYRIFPEILGTFGMEFFHGIYFFYYLALVIFPWMVLKKQRQRVLVYVYTLTVTMAIHHTFIMLFPSSGPVFLRAESMPDGYIFIPIMNWIYFNFDAGGGAFPSLHVAATMILYFFSIQFFPKARIPVTLFILGILISTVAGSFHYSIDVLAGIITGTLCFLLIPGTYNKFIPENINA